MTRPTNSANMDEDPSYDIRVCNSNDRQVIDENPLCEAVSRTLRRFGRESASISIALVDDDEIADLNKRFLDHDGPTDVLTFDIREDGVADIDGEIVISLQTASREAAARNHETMAELLLYAVHGTLHLLGINDATIEQATSMHAIEDQVLGEMGFADVYRRGLP